MTTPSGSGRNPYKYPLGDGREQIQLHIQRDLKQVPGLEDIRLEPSETSVEFQVVADVDTAIFAEGVIEATTASVQTNWWPLHDDEDRHWYQYHYYDNSGFDCGWHRHENDHVDGLDHYQERTTDDPDDYEYYSVSLEHETPVGILWELMGHRLPERLKLRYD